MEFTLKLLNEHAELTTENAVLKWRIERYENLLEEVMAYLCEEDVLAAQYAMKYKGLKNIEIRSKK